MVGRLFDPDVIDMAPEEEVGRRHALPQLQRLAVFAAGDEVVEPNRLPRHGVGRPPDPAGGAGHEGEGRQGIAARQHLAAGAHQVLQVHQVALGVLDVLDVVELQQAGIDLRRDVEAGMLRDVVEHDGDRDGLGNGLEVIEHAAGVRSLEVGRQDHERIGPLALGALRLLDGLGSADGRCLGHHRHPPVDVGDADLDDARLLVLAQIGELAGPGAEHDAVHPGLQHGVQVVAQARLVERLAGLVERRRQRRHHAVKLGHGLFLSSRHAAGRVGPQHLPSATGTRGRP